MTKTKHNSNRELIGQGIGNMLAAVIGGIPGAGATKGTVVNINAGGRTRLSGIIHGTFLLAVLLGLGQLAGHIPLCVLAGLLIPIGFKIVDFKGLKHLRKVPKSDAIVLILVLLITTFGSLIQAVGLGLALACLLFMKKAGDMSENGLEVGNVADFDGESPWQDELEFYDAYKDKVIIKHLYGPLFFGFTSYFKDQIKTLPSDITAVIFRMDRVPYMDQSGLYTLEDIVFDLRAQNIEVIFVGLKEQPKEMLEAVDIIPDLVPEEDVFDNIQSAFADLKLKIQNQA
jgi:SulP family sulfate permease